MASSRMLNLLLVALTPSPYIIAFQSTTPHSIPTHVQSPSSHHLNARIFAQNDEPTTSTATPITASMPKTRRAILSFLISTTTTTTAASVLLSSPTPAHAAEEESFANIAARAANLANQAKDIEAQRDVSKEMAVVNKNSDSRSAYDFSLPVAGKSIPFREFIKQENIESGGESDEEKKTKTKKGVLVKAILVVNMKQDDPIARKNIPELISLAAKFGRTKEFAVIMTPTDQGYFEPDTSELIRLKLASEYGYGLNPATLLTDKVNLLGSGAHPFWRWIEGTCRTPSGLGRIQGNFEKFLIDGQTGKPLRRYPRQYQPFDIADDIDALCRGKSFPPAGANWKEEWRSADKEAVADQFRFQKGLNVFDE